MEPRLASLLPKIAALCERFGVEHLDLFGSAARDDFAPASSDYDFLVEFDESVPGSKALRWIELADELEKLLGRDVDLVSRRYIENPLFRQEVESTRVTVYERKSSEAAG